MTKNILKTIINASSEKVFSYFTNPENTPLWWNQVSKEETSEWPIKIGTTYRSQNKQTGTWSEFVVSDYKENQVFQLTSIDGSYTVRYTQQETQKNITELTYEEWVGVGELDTPFTMEELQSLKSAIEKESISVRLSEYIWDNEQKEEIMKMFTPVEVVVTKEVPKGGGVMGLLPEYEVILKLSVDVIALMSVGFIQSIGAYCWEKIRKGVQDLMSKRNEVSKEKSKSRKYRLIMWIVTSDKKTIFIDIAGVTKKDLERALKTLPNAIKKHKDQQKLLTGRLDFSNNKWTLYY